MGLLCAIISTAKFPVCWPCRPLCGEALVAKQMARHGETVLPEALLPDYHRLSQAERERAERLAAEAEASKIEEAKK